MKRKTPYPAVETNRKTTLGEKWGRKAVPTEKGGMGTVQSQPRKGSVGGGSSRLAARKGKERKKKKSANRLSGRG